MRKFAVILLVLCLLLAGCGKDVVPKETGADGLQMTVGIAFPGEGGSDWHRHGQALATALEEMGYKVLQSYASNDPQLQSDQVESMLLQGADCLVVTAVDSLQLTQILERAEESDVPVIAYQRLLMNTDAVDYHVALDFMAAGQQIGAYVVQQKQLATAAAEERTYSVEFFMGSPEDNSALLLHQGVMSVLQPYLDSGVLVCRSGRVTFEDTCIQNWSEATARNHYWEYVYDAYSESDADIFCVTGDGLADGLCAALEAAGYTSENWPLVTGLGGSESALARLEQGKQSMTLTVDAQALIGACVRGVQALLAQEQPATNTDPCHNGVETVPAWFCPAVS